MRAGISLEMQQRARLRGFRGAARRAGRIEGHDLAAHLGLRHGMRSPGKALLSADQWRRRSR
ncbi:MAG: hypothetical protein CK428_12055 [Mycobacterium sp.]|nr:MAG: hypothetical protein CK428_12055 [Mycobacterium sp.]